MQTNLYRIVQEQLTNIVKHAEARNVKINIRVTKKLIKLTASYTNINTNDINKLTNLKILDISCNFNIIADFPGPLFPTIGVISEGI